MRIAEYKRISTITEQRVIHHDAEYDNNGNITTKACSETVMVQVPVMGMVYRDATPKEISEFNSQNIKISESESTLSKLREQEYNTDPVINWYDSMLTVTEAAQQWVYYAAEGNITKMNELTALISEAKANIREKYPDNKHLVDINLKT